jgi:hypothetical protein
MNLFRGSWNVTEDDVPIHSPVRLLQKLSAYRASTGSPSASSSPSPQNERKSTILTESTNFFARLWRPNTQQPTPSPSILIASHEAASSSSFDHIPEPSPAHTNTSPCLSPSPRSNNRRMSFMREVSSKNSSQLSPFSPPLPPSTPPPPLQPQPTSSSTVTDPSFEDTTSEHPCDTASEYHSQSLETNVDSSNLGIDDEENPREQQGLTYDERHRRLSQSAKPAIPLVQQISSSPMRFTGEHHSDSLASPEANIDVSMVSFKKIIFLQKKKKGLKYS